MFAKLTLPRSSRLVQSADFKQLFQSAKNRLHTRHFSVLVYPNTLDHPRIGLAVSKKFTKSSVQRNRIKRLIRTHFRLKQHNLPAVDLLFFSKKGSSSLQNTLIYQELDELIQKISRAYP